METLADDPDPDPSRDSELLPERVGGNEVIRTVRGSVAYFTGAFVKTDEERVWNLIVKLSADPSAYVRSLAILNLEMFARVRGYMKPVLDLILNGGLSDRGLIYDESPHVRHRALRIAFFEMKLNENSIDLLYEAISASLEDSHPEIRSEAAERILDVVATAPNQRYTDLLQRVLQFGSSEERSAIAHRVINYMDTDDHFNQFKPVYGTLINDENIQVRDRVGHALEGWASRYPDDVAVWCCQLIELEGSSGSAPFSNMTGFNVKNAFTVLVQHHQEQAVRIFECLPMLTDQYYLGLILEEAKILPDPWREKARPIVEELLRQGVMGAPELLDHWGE